MMQRGLIIAAMCLACSVTAGAVARLHNLKVSRVGDNAVIVECRDGGQPIVQTDDNKYDYRRVIVECGGGKP